MHHRAQSVSRSMSACGGRPHRATAPWRMRHEIHALPQRRPSSSQGRSVPSDQTPFSRALPKTNAPQNLARFDWAGQHQRDQNFRKGTDDLAKLSDTSSKEEIASATDRNLSTFNA